MKAIGPLLAKAAFIVLAMTFAVACYAQVYQSAPTAPPPPPYLNEPPEACGSPYMQPKPSLGEDLSGKVLYIIPKASSGAYAIKNASYRQSAGRTFLVGKLVEAREKKYVYTLIGSTVWLAVDGIEAIYPFKSEKMLYEGTHEPEASDPLQPPTPGVKVPTHY